MTSARCTFTAKMLLDHNCHLTWCVHQEWWPPLSLHLWDPVTLDSTSLITSALEAFEYIQVPRFARARLWTAPFS